MATLNKQMKAIVLRNVDTFGKGCEIVRAEDFHVVFNENDVGFTIRYLHDDEYSFRVESATSVEKMHVTEAPGTATTVEESHRSWDQLHPAAVRWARRVDEEQKALPHIRRLVEATARIEDIEKRLEGIPDRYATKDELEELRRRLDDLERQATETMKASGQSAEEVAAAVAKLHAEVEALMQSAPHMKFRAVVRWVVHRLWSHASSPNTAPQISNAAETVRALAEAVTKNASG